MINRFMSMLIPLAMIAIGIDAESRGGDSSAFDPKTNRVYRFVESPPLSWDQARSNASSYTEAGITPHLATINSRVEQTFIEENFPTSRAWLGGLQTGTRQDPNGGWEWITGEPFEFSNWSGSEPSSGRSGTFKEDRLLMEAAGGWNDAPSFADYRAGYLLEYELRDPVDIVRNSVKIVSTEHGSIEAHFTPNFGLTLADAAIALDVDGFNWVQLVTPPTSVTAWRLPFFDRIQPAFEAILLDQLGTPYYFGDGLDDKRFATRISEPFIDPIIGGSTNMYLYTKVDDEANFALNLIDHYDSDSQQFYLNTNHVSGAGGIPLEAMILDASTLRFFDMPSLDSTGIVSQDLTTLFHSELVGMADGQPVHFGELLGTSFTWKSDRTHDGYGGVYGVSYLSTLAAPPGKGGVFDVRVIVPEPGALGLVTSALAVVLLRRRAIHERDCTA